MTSRRQYLLSFAGGLSFVSGCQGWGEGAANPTATPNVSASPEPPTETATETPTETATETPTETVETDTATESPTATEETDSPEPDTEEPTSTPEETESPEPETEAPIADIVVEDIVVRKAVSYQYRLGSSGLYTGEDTQYVVATVRSLEDPDEFSFTFETGEKSFDPGLPTDWGPPTLSVANQGDTPVWGRRARPREEPKYVAFTVPSPFDATDARIRVTGEETKEWQLPWEERKRLDAPTPRFELDSIDVPNEIRVGTPLRVELTATNVSKTEGRFLAAAFWPTKIYDDIESHIFERVVGPGQTVTVARDIPTEYTDDDEGQATLSVEGYVEAETTVRVLEATESG